MLLCHMRMFRLCFLFCKLDFLTLGVRCTFHVGSGLNARHSGCFYYDCDFLVHLVQTLSSTTHIPNLPRPHSPRYFVSFALLLSGCKTTIQQQTMVIHLFLRKINTQLFYRTSVAHSCINLIVKPHPLLIASEQSL